MVQFLEVVNALPPALPPAELQQRILTELRKALEPFRVYTRLWIANNAWKTLSGLGEHPALRPGSPHHLPMIACPAFALRQPFRYSQKAGEPCSGRNNLITPITSAFQLLMRGTCFGVLFLGTFAPQGWDAEEIHLFEMLAQAVALTLQRRALLERLEEKITELNFSFEVGVAALATFVGSTQSIDETTVHILDSVLAILKVDRASLMLWNPQTQISYKPNGSAAGDFWNPKKCHCMLKTGERHGRAGRFKIGESPIGRNMRWGIRITNQARQPFTLSPLRPGLLLRIVTSQ